MANAALDIEKLVYDNANATTHIVCDSPSLSVDGFVTSELRIALGNSYSSPLQNQAQDALAAAAEAGKAVFAGFMTKYGWGEGDLPAWTPKSASQSVYTWAGADRPKFTLEMIFLALKGTDDVRKKPIQLLQGVVPSFETLQAPGFLAGALSSTVIVPPLRYLPQGLAGARGSVQVNVGRWFLARKLLITHVDFTFSKETLPTGLPIYSRAAVTFEPYRILSFDEVQMWFQ